MRMPPKPHSEMTLGKNKAKRKKNPGKRKTKRGASPPTWRSCRSCCGGGTDHPPCYRIRAMNAHANLIRTIVLLVSLFLCAKSAIANVLTVADYENFYNFDLRRLTP